MPCPVYLVGNNELEAAGNTMKMIQEAQREDHQLLQMIIGYPECQIIPEDLAVAMQVTSQAQRGY